MLKDLRTIFLPSTISSTGLPWKTNFKRLGVSGALLEDIFAARAELRLL
jgi:hypothetical protein